MAIGDEQEYRVPIKILTQRDPIIGGKLSMRELGQWVFFLILIYLAFNVLPLPFQINIAIGGTLLMVAFVFIHVPVNGLSGIEWIYINIRYRLEKALHLTQGIRPEKDIAVQKPIFEIKMAVAYQQPSGDGNGEDIQEQEEAQEI